MTNSWPYHFHTLSPPAYNLVAVVESFVLSILSENLASDFIFPAFTSFNMSFNSDTTTFSSSTPSSTFLPILSIRSCSLSVLPAPNISSKTILNASCTDAEPPICPLCKGKKDALPKLRVCVAGENTVLPVCTMAL